MTNGFSLVPIDYDMHEFAPIVIGVVILTIVLLVIISIVFEVTARTKDTMRDERDIAIERKGAVWGYSIVQIGVLFVISGMLLNNSVDHGHNMIFAISTPVQVVFGLIVTLYIADIVKHAVMVHGYGR